MYNVGNTCTYQTEHAARDFIGCYYIAKYERVFNGNEEYVVAF